MENTPELREAVRFHGHLCPGLAIGYRVVMAARDRGMGLRASDEEMVALVENDSCAVDAIQALTGCTFGKGNLRFEDHGKQVFTLWDRERARGLRISLRASALKDLRDASQGLPPTQRRERVIKRVLEMPLEELFDFQEVADSPPEPAVIEESIQCDQCGEPVMASRLQAHGGKRLCVPCLRQLKRR